MAVVKYPKFCQTGTHTNVPACPSTTAVSFSIEFDDTPVIVANLTSTCGWAGATNITTAGFDLWAENTGTCGWIAIYQSI